MSTLHGRFFLLIAALVCGNGMLALLLQTHDLRTYEMAMTQALNAPVAATLAREVAAAAPLQGGSAEATPALRGQLHRLMAINPTAEIYLLDAEGRVLASSTPATLLHRTRVSLPPLLEFIAGRSTLPVTGDDPREADGERIFSAAPLGGPGGAGGFVYVVLGGSEARDAAGRIQTGLLLRTALTVLGLGLVVALLTAFVVMTTLTRRLRRLARAIELFSRGQFREPRPIPTRAGGDEVDALGRAYNDMVDHIDRQMRTIAQSQASRQELIAHVSHDLRTPLASLRGYLETLQVREGSLSAEERRTYIGVAVRQAGTMDRMIGELFDLATLEDLEAPLLAEPFQLSELVQDVVQKFGLIAVGKAIALRGVYLPDAPMIRGDIGLIERLLDNLLENALRHTPPGGEVAVRVAKAADGVILEVSDTGSGIPVADIDTIFERGRRSVLGGGFAGAGLGLAIVKRIVELHHGGISVRGGEGEGTSFQIMLPADP